LQKCFINIEIDSENNFNKIKLFLIDILNMKDVFNMELGYAASMIFILVISLESEQSLTKSIEKTFSSYDNNNGSVKISLKDLCFFQALLTMLKPNQFVKNYLLSLFVKIVVFTLNRYFFNYILQFSLLYLFIYLFIYVRKLLILYIKTVILRILKNLMH